MYMTPAQRNQLTAGDYAKSCRIRCTPLGFRLPFSTLDTESTWANSATLVQTVHGIGIESHIPTRLARYESATSKLAEVTGLHDPSADEQIKTLYGSTSLDDIPASWMIPRHWNQYAHFIAHKDEVLDLGPYCEICSWGQWCVTLDGQYTKIDLGCSLSRLNVVTQNIQNVRLFNANIDVV